MPLLIAALLGLSAAIVVLYPLLGLDRATGAESASDAALDATLSDEVERERSAKLALRDVNFDYRLGNLDPEDYVALRDRYERRALAAMKTRYDREQALDDLIDRQLDVLRTDRANAPQESAAHAEPATGAHERDAANPSKAAGTAGRAAAASAAAARPAPEAGPRVRRRRAK